MRDHYIKNINYVKAGKIYLSNPSEFQGIFCGTDEPTEHIPQYNKVKGGTMRFNMTILAKKKYRTKIFKIINKDCLLGWFFVFIFFATQNNCLYGEKSPVFGMISFQPRSGEFLIDTTIVYTAAPDEQRGPHIAFDGVNYFVVWADRRSGISYDVYGARVRPDGTVLDPNGIAISSGPWDEFQPNVCFDGVNYFVVWADKRNGSYWDLYGARINREGVILDTLGFPINTEPNSQTQPSIAFDGTNYLIAWTDNRYSLIDLNIYGSRISPSGVVLDPAGFPICSAPGWQYGTDIAFDGTNYLVVWADFRESYNTNITGARVSPGGIVLDEISISSAPDHQDMPGVAFDGNNFFVVWEDLRNHSHYDIYGTRINRNGIVLDPSGIPISTAINRQQGAQVAFDGTNYLVVWLDYRNNSLQYPDIYGTRVTPNGTVLEPSGITISNAVSSQEYPELAFGGINYLIAWTDWRGVSADIYGARMASNGTVLDPAGILISIGTNFEERPVVVFDGNNYLVAWEDNRNGSYDIYGMRVTQTGMILNPYPITISNSPGSQTNIAATFGGSNYFVVWEDNRDGEYNIYGARISPSGTVLDPAGIPISTATGDQRFPSVAFDGTNYLVVWHDDRNYSDIYGARVSTGGTVLDPSGFRIGTGANYRARPNLIFGNTTYLVVWVDYRNDPYTGNIYGARVDTNGTVLDPSGILVSNSSVAPEKPGLAFDGTNYMVLWSDYRNGNADIYGTRVSTAGSVLDPQGIPICVAPNVQNLPAAIFNSTNYFIVWQDYRNNEWDIYGAKVNVNGNVIGNFDVSLQTGRQNSPAVAHGIGGNGLIVYAGWCDYINGNPAKTTHIWGKIYPFVGTKESLPYVGPRVSLLQIYPNPFNAELRIRIRVSDSFINMFNSDIKSQTPSLKIYNTSGCLVREYHNLSPYLQSGFNQLQINWDGTDNEGHQLPNGIYFITFDGMDIAPIKIVRIK